MNTQLKLIEKKLFRMRELDEQIKVLEAEKKMLKDELITSWFVDHTEYKTAKGLTLATYKGMVVYRFQQKEFEKDHFELFNQYKKESIEFRFLLK